VRVLHVSPYFAPAFRYGGPPRSILGLCRALQRAGVDVEVLTTTADGDADLPATPPGGDSYEGVAVRYLPRAFPRRLFGARGLGAALKAAVARADLVHVHGLWTLPGWAAARHARRGRVPVVISPRGMLDPGSVSRRAWRKRVAYGLVERWNLRSAAFLHATSEAEADALRRWAPGVPVVTLPNGVDGPETAPAPAGSFRRRLGIPDTDTAPIVAFLGRIHPIKRLDLLAAAFDRVRATRPDAHLVVAGLDEGGERKRIEPRFAAAGAHVHWAGEVDGADKWELLTASECLVLCSDSESFGTSVAEAMAAGLPVVVTHSCPWSVVEAERCGFWVPQEASAMAGAVVTLLNDPAKAREMGARGKALAQRTYSWDSIGRAMAERYRSAVAVSRWTILTPGMSGTDGVSQVSRMAVRALPGSSVLSLNDLPASPWAGPWANSWSRKRRLVWAALRRALGPGPAASDILCMHLHLSPLGWLMVLRGGRLCLFLHGIEAWKPLGLLRRIALRRAAVVMANSDHTVRRFREANPGFASRAIPVCHLGVGEAAAAPASGEAGPFALIVGRLAAAERYKGHDLLVEMWPRVLAQCPGARLVVAGDGDDRPRLELAAAPLGNAVRFTRSVDDAHLAALYRDCAFFVMPSREEGFGLVFLEAMRAGKACIGAIGAAAELIEDGVTGFVVDPDDAARIQETVVRLFQDRALAKRLGEAGALRWAHEFTEDAFAERLRALVARSPRCVSDERKSSSPRYPAPQ
jgi:glycosyltransferase involved in cell wall biosynthesis